MMKPSIADPGRCGIRLGLLVPEDRVEETELWERNWERVTSTISTEDFAQAEQIQAGFATGIQSELLIGRTELGMQLFYQAIEGLVPLN